MNIHIAKTIRLIAGTITTALVFSAGIARPDTILDWNAIMQATVAAQAPFPQARFAAITQLAVFEAVNAITREYKPYLGTIAAPADASAEAAAVAAAHSVLKNYFPSNAATLDAARASSLATIPDGSAKSSGITIGEMAAAAVIALRSDDGSGPPAFYMPASSDPGQWQLTPSCPAAGGAFFHWRNVKPLVLRSADQFQLDEPPALNSARYARDYNEVKAVGGTNSALRPKDRTDVARLFAAVSPVGVWNPIARQLSIAAGNSLSENARAFALLNLALSDAAVATFDTKYRFNFWRPETAIRMGYADDNERTEADATFTPLITTPSSCTASAQKWFSRGAALLHSFGYEEARLAFNEAAKADPSCGIAHWGVARTWYHPISAPPSPDELKQGTEAIDRALAAGAKTERERDYIVRPAVARRHGHGDAQRGGVLQRKVHGIHGLLRPGRAIRSCLRAAPTDGDHRWLADGVMRGFGNGIVESLIGVGREVNHNPRAGRHRSGNLDIEHHFRIGILVRAGAVSSAIHGHRAHLRRAQTQRREIRSQIRGAVSASQLDDSNGLALPSAVRREIVQGGDLQGSERLRGFGRGPYVDVRLCNRAVVQTEHGLNKILQLGGNADVSSPAAIRSV